MSRLILLIGMLAGGCMHLKGVVEEGSGRPSKTAVLSVGRPDAVAVYSRHPVDSKGCFDFWVSLVNEDNVYVYDRRGDPQTTLRRINETEMSENMHLLVPPGISGIEMTPDMR